MLKPCRQYLQSQGIKCLYHFTERKNLASIKSMGGLYSWKHLESLGIDYASGGDGLSHSLDCRYNLEDFVRLSFRESHPMSYRKRQEGTDLVVLQVSLDAADIQGVLFSDMNATDSMHTTGSGLDFLQTLNLEATKRAYVCRTDPDFKVSQAEILVPHCVPASMILNLNEA